MAIHAPRATNATMRIGILCTFLSTPLFARVGGRSVIEITLPRDRHGTRIVHFTLLGWGKLIKYLFA
jgi:hypothetical protein